MFLKEHHAQQKEKKKKVTEGPGCVQPNFIKKKRQKSYAFISSLHIRPPVLIYQQDATKIPADLCV